MEFEKFLNQPGKTRISNKNYYKTKKKLEF